MKNHFDFKNQTAIITGASSGLGVEMAQVLANYGANIVLLARRKELIDKIADEIKNTYSVETLAIPCDVTDTKQIKNAMDLVLNKFSKIDILINNAGTGIGKHAEDITDEEFYNDINVDLLGEFRMAREVANASMIKQKYGRIINISSMAGMIGNNLERELGVPYYAAKGGVVNMTRALAAEWGKYNINVNTICPGYFYTDMTKDGLDNKDFLETIKNRIPLARYAEVSELDTAVLFLASKASSYITGVCLPVDGGYTCM